MNKISKAKGFGEMHMDNKIKGFKWDTVLSSVLYVIVGTLLVIFPISVIKSLCYAIAIIIMAIGIIKIISFLLKEQQEGFTRTGLISGIIFVIIGAFIAIRSKTIISIIPFILGILILFSGISKLQYTMQLRKYSDEKNSIMLITSIINVILGIVLAFNPFRAARVMLIILGICMIITGLSDLVSAIYFYGKIRNHIKDMEALEQDYVEKK